MTLEVPSRVKVYLKDRGQHINIMSQSVLTSLSFALIVIAIIGALSNKDILPILISVAGMLILGALCICITISRDSKPLWQYAALDVTCMVTAIGICVGLVVRSY